jgi:TetR/AcrR family transcriptional regulator of autoinduction and epiphytic fitness
VTLEASTAGEQVQEEQETPVDGRTARGQRTRASVVDALLALQEEGDLAPTAQRVAARAGVALRTVFGHFSDMETLWAEAGQRELEKLGTIAERPHRSLPLEQRIDAYCASRARVLEALLPVARAARLREPTSPALQRNREMFIAAGDAEVRDVFAHELAELDEPGRARLMDALYVVSSGPSWDILRTDRGLEPDEAAGVMRRLVTDLLVR